MTWTNEKPTVEGWYWYRDKPGASERVVELYHWQGGPKLFYREIGRILGMPIFHDEAGQFAGPIPKPEEAK
jgi:hypothetical protein